MIMRCVKIVYLTVILVLHEVGEIIGFYQKILREVNACAGSKTICRYRLSAVERNIVLDICTVILKCRHILGSRGIGNIGIPT